jgi:NitT/TauT family transport system substrate-binding protein
MTRLRIVYNPSICTVPQFVAEELLKAEGFTDVHHVPVDPALGLTKFIGRDHADLASSFAGSVIVGIDAQEPVLLLAGMHVGCYELFATSKGRRWGSLRCMTAGTYLSPVRSRTWVWIRARTLTG